MILVDTNVLLDIVTADRRWGDWSERQLEAAAFEDELAVNGVIYAELSIGFGKFEEVDALIEAMHLRWLEIPRAALFLAGKAFRSYRARGGLRSGVLPDFFIGAHASIISARLLTRDEARYSTYFPRLRLITPRPE